MTDPSAPLAGQPNPPILLPQGPPVPAIAPPLSEQVNLQPPPNDPGLEAPVPSLHGSRGIGEATSGRQLVPVPQDGPLVTRNPPPFKRPRVEESEEEQFFPQKTEFFQCNQLVQQKIQNDIYSTTLYDFKVMEVNSRLETVVTQLNGQAEGLTRVLRDHDEGLRTLAESHLLHLEQSKESTEEYKKIYESFMLLS